jgi:hypothetical protein
MSHLFFIGCSFTAGDDLDSPATQSWPVLVSQGKNSSFENHAVSGGTNDRIIYHTMKNAGQFDHYYIAWTYHSRFTLYRRDNNFEVNFNQQLEHTLYGKNPEYNLYGKIYYQYWFNELFALKLWLQRIILLQSFLRDNNLSYTMINSTHNDLDKWTINWSSFNASVKSLLCFDKMDDEQLYQEHIEIQKLVDLIDKTAFVGWNQWSIENDIAKNFPLGQTGHPLTEGHRAIADYILINEAK